MTPSEFQGMFASEIKVSYGLGGLAILDLGKAGLIIDALDNGWNLPADQKFPITSERWQEAVSKLQGAYSSVVVDKFTGITEDMAKDYMKEIKKVWKR
jgi:hypothetical protein